MKKLTLAFLYNIRHQYPDPDDPKTFLEADFDDPLVIKAIIKHLKVAGFEVIAIEANKEAYLRLYKNKEKIDLAFYYAEGMYGKGREAQIPAMLEMLNIPYTGSSVLTHALLLNKAMTKEILKANDLPVLSHQIFKTNKENLKKSLKFPLIVKPIAQGSSAGITNESVVTNKEKLYHQVNSVIKIFRQEALVEPFLKGREFSIALLGNPPKVLPIIEANHSLLPKNLKPLDSLEVKWYFEEKGGEDHLICPAKLTKKLEKRIKEISLAIWQALEIFDLCRIDIRCDEEENPYVLEVNSPAGIIPPEISTTSYFPLAARKAGFSYEDLLRKIIKSALKRYGSL